MILVDIVVPSVDKKYDFRLNENQPVSAVIEEIAMMIGQKEQSPIVGDRADLRLCDKKSGRILSNEDTLSSAGVGTGGTLILV